MNFPTSGKAGETFGGREDKTVKDLGLAPRADLILETRGGSDPPFREFDPNEFSVQVARWDPSACAEVPGSCKQVRSLEGVQSPP